MKELDIGILIIGSLLWDRRPHRECWRDDRLLCNNAVAVTAPIRYGRMSQSRGNTYTMVFSNALVPDRLGSALAVPCVERASAADDLVNEAEMLWAAEQAAASKPGPVSGSWGAVGLLLNPARSSLDEVRETWARRVAAEREYYSGFPHMRDERPALGADGLLTIPWPATTSGQALDLDALLATATRPSLPTGDYATAAAIAAAWTRAPAHKDYFENNRRAGILTYEDEDILRLMMNRL